MTVGFLTASVSRNAGGVYDAMRRLTLEISGLNGWRSCVFGLEDASTANDLPAWMGVSVTATAVRGPRAFGYSPQLLRALQAARPDLVHQHGLWMYPSLVCRTWASQARQPYVVSPHGMLDAWALSNSRWKKRLAAWLYENANLRGAACLHALCEAEARAMRAYGLENPVAVIPNGVDLPRSVPRSKPAWGAGLPEGARVLLYLGRLHPKKGLPNLIRAWAEAPSHSREGWFLVIAGWDQSGHEAEMRSLTRELGIEASVRFVGPQFGQDKEASLASAAAFVLPSFSEGLPMAVLEAWAYGLPVLMTRQCNLPEGFAAGAAIAAEPDPASVAEGLRALLAMSDAERREMGQRGRRLVEEKFSWPKIAVQMKEVYEWVLGAGPKPACISTQ